MNKMTLTDYLLLLLIALVMMFTAQSTPAQAAESYDMRAKDKVQHIELFAVIDEAGYIIARNLNSEHPILYPWLISNGLGFVKELTDGSRFNKHPTPFSPPDLLANLIGTTVMAAFQLGAEEIEKKYGYNPLLIKINPAAKSLHVEVRFEL